jgi:hypothetical protein
MAACVVSSYSLMFCVESTCEEVRGRKRLKVGRKYAHECKIVQDIAKPNSFAANKRKTPTHFYCSAARLARRFMSSEHMYTYC